MNGSTILVSAITSVIVTPAVLGMGWKLFGDWLLEKQKNKYSRELESFRDQLQQQQRRVQARIDRSVFVTRAHFETEFAAMKDVFKYWQKHD